MNKRIAFFMAAMFGVASAMASTTWYVDARHGSNGYSGLTAFAPKRTIQSAINAASSGDWIIVAGGTYTENLTLSKKLTLFSHEHAVSIIEGRHAGHCLLITENASGSVVDGFVFTHGAPTNAGNKYGGGVDCLANATIRHCVFKDNGNSSTTFAGGLHTSNRAQVSVENCLFTGNYAWACGGASLTEGGSTATFDRCTVYGNKSDDFIGNQGGIGVATADNPAAADALADSGLAVIDRAINLFPDRLDLRFGKIFFLGEIRQWQPFADEIITTLNRSESIGHRWQYPNFDQGGRQLIIEGVQDYLYTLYEASQAAPADGSPAAQASLTPAQTDVMPHIRRVALRAAQLFPAEPSFLSSLAYTYIAEADYPTALRHLNRAEQLAPNDPAILQQLVDIHTRMKNKKQANIYRTRLAEQTRP